MTSSPSKGTALITGASTGIGAVYADHLAKRGQILVAPNEARLKALCARLTSRPDATSLRCGPTSMTRRLSRRWRPPCGMIRLSP